MSFLYKYKYPILGVIFFILITSFFTIKYKIDFNEANSLVDKVNEKIDNGELSNDKLVENGWRPQKIQISSNFSIYFALLICTHLKILPIVAIFVIILVSGYNLFNKLKSGNIRAELLRKNYKQFLYTNIKDALKSSFIIPFIIIIWMTMCYIVSRKIGFETNWNYIDKGIDSIYIQKPVIFFIQYFLGLLFISGYYINIGLICIKKFNNYLVSVVCSFLIVMGINIVLEVIGYTLEYRFKIVGMNATFNNFCYWYPTDGANMNIMTLTAIILFFGSLLYLIINYKDKERVLIENGL